MSQTYKKLYEQEMKKFNSHWVMEVMKELQPKDLKATELKDWKERSSQIDIKDKFELLHEHLESSHSYDYYSCAEDLSWFKLMFENDTLPYMIRNKDNWLFSVLGSLVFNDSDEPYEITEKNRDIIDFFLGKTTWAEGEFEDFITKYCEKFPHHLGGMESSLFPLLEKYHLMELIPQEAMSTFSYDALTAHFVDEQILNLALSDKEITVKNLINEHNRYYNENPRHSSFIDENENSFQVYESIMPYMSQALKNSDNLLKLFAPHIYYSFNKISVNSYLDVEKLSQIIQMAPISEKDFTSQFLVSFLDKITSKEFEKANTNEIIDFTSDYLKYYNQIAKNCGFTEAHLTQDYSKTKFFEQVNTLLEKTKLDLTLEEKTIQRKIKL